jgi:hypothetical protein
MEQNGVPENDWAQIFGHERGFTYSRYNPDGIQLDRKKAIIELIAYPTVALPDRGSSSYAQRPDGHEPAEFAQAFAHQWYPSSPTLPRNTQ